LSILKRFVEAERPWSIGGAGGTKDWYRSSYLSPVAPEQATVEVLLGGAYRKLVTGETDAEIDLDKIPELPGKLADAHGQAEGWEELLGFGGLGSPSTEKRDRRQLVQLVPALANHAGVIGGVRNRWSPGNLLINAVQSGVDTPRESDGTLASFARALSVDNTDDLLARYLEQKFTFSEGRYPTLPESFDPIRPTFRRNKSSVKSPAERLARDLPALVALKEQLSRRQWTLLVEAMLRVSLYAHYSWLLGLNIVVWEACRGVMEGAEPASSEKIASQAWERHARDHPFLELGQDSGPPIKKLIRKYAQARLGLGLILTAMQAAGIERNPLAPMQGSGAMDTPETLASFLESVSENREPIQAAFVEDGVDPYKESLRDILDRTSGFQAASTGPTRNTLFFLRYTAGRITPSDLEQVSYDQSYLLDKTDRARRNAPWECRLGPVLVTLLVHLCCRDSGTRSVSVSQFERYLADWGIRASQRELTVGSFARMVEQMGIMVDSPDAGGGRLLMDPLNILVH
jgi:hypothetical protein